jgi:pyruvate/2-oxoglutarate dehydrogenase complex dihydrolipoamide dehydrogenase (E3) component
MTERPLDRHDERLLERVAPPDWANPIPARRYHLLVVGGGTAGLVAAAGAAGLGARVALVERDRLGGDCLNTGCVPSKALLRSARAEHDVRSAGAFGVRTAAGPVVDFGAVMERMRRLRAEIALHDAAARFRTLGVDVFLGEARFTSRDRIEVRASGDGTRAELRFWRAVVATGAQPVVPAVPGLDEVDFLTSETLWSLTELPARIAVLGAGPIGCELAQAFARFGAQVVLVEREARILPRDDPEAASLIADALQRDGIEILLACALERVESSPPTARLRLVSHAGREVREVDRIVLAVGRAARLAGLGLEKAGVAQDGGRIRVDAGLRTTNRRVYAAGDVCASARFTHVADAHARVVVRNALFPGRERVDVGAVPWCVFTDPELAHVGHTAESASRAGIRVTTYTEPLSLVDRALLDGEDAGFARIHVRKGSDEIVGATLVARHAGETITEIAVAITAGMGLDRLAGVIHPYPTQAEAFRKIADQFRRSRLTPFVQRVLERWFSLRG